MKKFLVATAATLLCALGSARAETVLDLTTGPGGVGSGTINNAIFARTDQRPTGTGVIDSFSRLQHNGLEEGFNTNGTPPWDEKAGLYTHAIQLSSLATFNIGGTAYYQFLLDVNQTSSNPLINLNRLQLWTASSATLTQSDYTFGSGGDFDVTGNTNGAGGVLAGGTLAYDIDTGKDNGVLLDYSLNSGSGSGDMSLYVKASAFGSDLTKYLYLYSAFGTPNVTNDGFEEWAASTTSAGTPFGAPEPSTIALALSGLVGAGFAGLRRLRRPQAATV